MKSLIGWVIFAALPVILLITLLVTAAVFTARHYIVDYTEYADGSYKIVGIKYPKHFRLTLQDMETSEVYENVYVSKHYARAKDVPLNSLIVARKKTVTYRDGSQKVFIDIDDVKKELIRLTKEKS